MGSSPITATTEGQEYSLALKLYLKFEGVISQMKNVIIFIVALLLVLTLVFGASSCSTHDSRQNVGTPDEVQNENNYIDTIGYNMTNAKTVYYYRDFYTDNMYVGTLKSGITPLYDKNGNIMKYQEFEDAVKYYNIRVYDD